MFFFLYTFAVIRNITFASSKLSKIYIHIFFLFFFFLLKLIDIKIEKCDFVNDLNISYFMDDIFLFRFKNKNNIFNLKDKI